MERQATASRLAPSNRPAGGGSAVLDVVEHAAYTRVSSHTPVSLEARMDRLDALHARIDILEHHLHHMTAHTQKVTQRLRWWRGVACGALLLTLLGLPLSSGTAHAPAADSADGETLEAGSARQSLQQRVEALEQTVRTLRRKLVAVTFDAQTRELLITQANVRIVNGLGSTDCFAAEGTLPNCPNGLGNLIVGYNESRVPQGGEDIRTGSHNVVVGPRHNFSRVGGLVVGASHTIDGDFAVVSGGRNNTASGLWATVSGGIENTATGDFSSVSGGYRNTASGDSAAVCGGANNRASSEFTAVSGGASNTASGLATSVSGGVFNRASSEFAVVSGGRNNTASGLWATVSGGYRNTASGTWSTVSGGVNRTAAGDHDWSAGSFFADE